MSDWYYSLLGEEFGPVSADTIHELLQDGTLDASDPVRSSDSENSITAAQFLQLHSQPEAEDATEAEEGSDLFWFQLEGITLGPVAGQSLIRLAEIGRISRDTLIRRDNEFLWEPASEFHELSIVFMLGQSDSSPSTGTATTKASSPQPIPEEAPAPVKRSTGNPTRGTTTPAAAGRQPRSGAGARKLVNSRRKAEAAAKAEAEDAMLQEIFAELEQKKAAGRSETPRITEAAPSAVSAPSPAPAATAAPAATSVSPMSDPQRQAAAALAAARASTAAASAKPPKRRSSGGGFSIPNPFAGLSEMQFDGPVKSLIGVAVVALLWFGWGPVMSVLNSKQGEYIARVEETIQEIEKLNPATQPDVYTKQMEKIAREFNGYSVVMTAAASQRESAKTCLAAVNRLVEFARTDPLNARLQKKLLDETKKLVKAYRG
ncbi:MAG: hypothetical protein ACK5EN_02125 [Planctomyces sp.]|jgi:chemotaxis protein histidine kinase CheA